MKQRNELLLHLIGEVGHFILDSDPGRMVINLHLEDSGFHLTVLDDVERSDEEIEAITEAIHAKQRPELAGYYGSMAGVDLIGSARLEIVGWQVKSGMVKKREGGTQIDLWLGGDRFDPAKFNMPADGC
ncbi:MAG: hypothetical protein ACLFPO_13255 [Spirochaetaceae bacterium]